VTRKWGKRDSESSAEVTLRAGGGVPARFWLWFAGLWFCPGLAFRVYIAYGLKEEAVGDRFLAISHDAVDELGEHDVTMEGVGKDIPPFGGAAA